MLSDGSLARHRRRIVGQLPQEPISERQVHLEELGVVSAEQIHHLSLLGLGLCSYYCMMATLVYRRTGRMISGCDRGCGTRPLTDTLVVKGIELVCSRPVSGLA